MIVAKSYPRAAVIGNPSDGYNGRTIAFVFSNFSAEATLTDSDQLCLVPGQNDRTVYHDLSDLDCHIESDGYYGGMRLLKAAVRQFVKYCRSNGIGLPGQNFAISYKTTIPARVGLAGSSAIITAVLKAILQFYNITITKPDFANLVLAAETVELGIAAGLQDRVAQAYEQPVYMDFASQYFSRQGYGHYEVFGPELFPKLYIAWRKDVAEGSEKTHNDLRARYEVGEHKVVNSMLEFGRLTTEAYQCLKSRQPGLLGGLMDRNFDLRRSICTIAPRQLEMVELARSCGASAKFTGSGGAIIGSYDDDAMYNRLSAKLEGHGISIVQPKIVSP